jgi:hypothetical protein
MPQQDVSSESAYSTVPLVVDTVKLGNAAIYPEDSGRHDIELNLPIP